MVFSIVSGALLFISGMSSLAVSIRAFYMYFVTRSERLFTVGLSMAIVSIGIACSALNGLPFLPPINLGWAWYAGTSVGFFFFFLNSLMKTDEQFNLLKRWEIIATALVITLIALTPVLPPFTNPVLPVTLDTLRTVICSLCFFRYLILYTSKGTRFSLLMCLTFFFITASYGIIIPATLNHNLAGLAAAGTAMRIVGDIILFVAFVVG
jgi:hypothetical protein